MTSQQEMMIDQGLQAWQTQYKRATELVNILSDEQLEKPVAPGRNTGVYLVAHLIAIHDRILPLFGLGESLHPELFDAVVENPESANLPKPSISKLRDYWKEVHQHLENRLKKMEPEEWFQKHTAVSEEDFAKEPHRNRFNVLLNRTNHFSYHLGQIALLKPKS